MRKMEGGGGGGGGNKSVSPGRPALITDSGLVGPLASVPNNLPTDQVVVIQQLSIG